MARKKVLILHNNAPAHSSIKATFKLNELRFKLAHHPLWSPDQDPSNYYLFPCMKRFRQGKQFTSNAGCSITFVTYCTYKYTHKHSVSSSIEVLFLYIQSLPPTHSGPYAARIPIVPTAVASLPQVSTLYIYLLTRTPIFIYSYIAKIISNANSINFVYLFK